MSVPEAWRGLHVSVERRGLSCPRFVPQGLSMAVPLQCAEVQEELLCRFESEHTLRVATSKAVLVCRGDILHGTSILHDSNASENAVPSLTAAL